MKIFKKILKYLFILFIIGGVGYAAYFFVKTNKKSAIEYETEDPFITSIEKKTVATGKVIPEVEVEIKPQISGILEKVYVKEGKEIKAGDLIAKVKVVPNEASLNSARNRVKNAKIVLDNSKTEYDRNKKLFDKGIISNQDFNQNKLNYSQAKQELENAQSDMKVIKQGTSGGGSANTNIRATVSGTILEIPVKKGDQVIESNNFNPGTTVTTIADLSKMIFEGKVDEAEVGKLKIGMPLKISLGAINDKEFDAKLRFIAPKGNEESGAVQFKIEGDVYLDEDFFVRAGYSANASLVLEKKDDCLAIKEALLQFDKETPKTKGEGFVRYWMPKPCWAIMKFLIEPGEQGSGVVFTSKVGVNDIKQRYQNEVERTIDEALKQGIKGWEVTDLKITLIEGEDHEMHTKPGDFSIATPMGIMNGLNEIGTTLLEPILSFKIVADESFLGAITSDITQLRGSFESPEIENGKMILTGLLPAATSIDYPVKLSSRSGGKAKYSTQLHSYAPCSDELGMIRPFKGISPLDTAKYILKARKAIQ